LATAFVTLLVLLFALPASALDFPALTGRVVDDANILDPRRPRGAGAEARRSRNPRPATNSWSSR